MKPEEPIVVLALDGSETALRGLEPARRIAAVLGANLDVLHVVPSPIVQPGLPEPILVADFRNGSGWDPEGRAYLTGHWEAIPGARVYVSFGRPAREIVRFAGQRKAKLVVVATRGRTGLPRAVLGSVAEECVRTSPVPVLVIPPGAKRVPLRPAALERTRARSGR